MSNNLRLEAPWDEVKEKLKEVNPELTDEDLELVPGQEDELLNRLAEKTGRSVDQVRMWVESVSSNRGKAS
jgi:uncharacterized protein YjbJ (UPF0337 family)